MHDVIEKYAEENGLEDMIIFENPDYTEAFIGHLDDGRAVYDYYKMVECLMKEDGMSEEDAMDFISFNTLRAIPYMGEKAPIGFYRKDVLE